MQTSCTLLLKSQQEICAAWVLKISKDSEVVLFKATLKSTPSASPFFSYSHLLQASRPEAQEVYLPLRKEQNRSKQQVSRWKQALAIQSHTTKISCRNQVNILQPESVCYHFFTPVGERNKKKKEEKVIDWSTIHASRSHFEMGPTPLLRQMNLASILDFWHKSCTLKTFCSPSAKLLSKWWTRLERMSACSLQKHRIPADWRRVIHWLGDACIQ